MKKKPETINKAAPAETPQDYSSLLPFLTVSLGEKQENLIAYVLTPAQGYGFAFAAVFGEENPKTFVGILDIATNGNGHLVAGSFGALVHRIPATYSSALGFFERFAAQAVSRDELAQVFGE
jgi:hypothetical protein